MNLFEKVFKKLNKEKNMKAYTFNPPPGNVLQIDIVMEDSLKFVSYNKRKTIQSMGKIKIPVVALSDIIKMKAKRAEKTGYDQETLMRWKNSSVKSKLDWLNDALQFAEAVKRARKKQ